jgi:spore coat polysaccharide biosynthesis predicted glycosyltransferase SpsG
MFGICVEASHQRGMGHLFRVLNLCQELSIRNIPFHIFINENKAAQKILDQHNFPFEVVSLESHKNDWQKILISKYGIKLWIDDRLNTDVGHAKQVKSCDIPLVSFDDRGSGASLVDLNVAALSFDETEPLQGKKVLRGSRYLVLNLEIERYKHLRTKQNSIVVSMGGSDTYGVTIKVVQILKSIGHSATIIIGPAFEHEAELRNILNDDFVLKKCVPSIIEEFSYHDLAITGGGITPFEANASGLPCIVIANEVFEILVGQGIANLGSAIFAGHYSAIKKEVFAMKLPIEKMSKSGMNHVDLLGATRVVNEIETII